MKIPLKQRATIDGSLALGTGIALLKILLWVVADVACVGVVFAVLGAGLAAIVGTPPGAAAERAALWSGGVTAVVSFLIRTVRLLKRVSELRSRLQVEVAMALIDQETKYEILCPDGVPRHSPYDDRSTAEFDAQTYSSAMVQATGCAITDRTEALHGRCPGGVHTVRTRTK